MSESAKRSRDEDRFQVETHNFLIRNMRADVTFHHSVNEGVRSKAAAGLAKAMGQRAGWPDWVLLWGGPILPKVAFIELKAAKGRTSEEQEEFLTEVHDIGIRHKIVRMVDKDMNASLDAFGFALTALGVPFRAESPWMAKISPPSAALAA